MEQPETAAVAVDAALTYLKKPPRKSQLPVSIRLQRKTAKVVTPEQTSPHGLVITAAKYLCYSFQLFWRKVAQCIEDRAAELGSDLVVMGAYGQSRLMEAVFGGTTRTMMEQKNFAGAPTVKTLVDITSAVLRSLSNLEYPVTSDSFVPFNNFAHR